MPLTVWCILYYNTKKFHIMNKSNKPKDQGPLQDLLDKLFSGYVKSPLCGICFEFTKDKDEELRVFTMKKQADHTEAISYESNEIDLTLEKFYIPNKGIVKTEDGNTSRIYHPNKFLLMVKTSKRLRTMLESVSEIEHTVLISELVKHHWLYHSEVFPQRQEGPAELSVQFKSRKFSYGYIGDYPYTMKNEKNQKIYLSIYEGIEVFKVLDPDYDKIRIIGKQSK